MTEPTDSHLHTELFRGRRIRYLKPKRYPRRSRYQIITKYNVETSSILCSSIIVFQAWGGVWLEDLSETHTGSGRKSDAQLGASYDSHMIK